MKNSAGCRYDLRISNDLAGHGNCIPLLLPEIFRTQQISAPYLRMIFQSLKTIWRNVMNTSVSKTGRFLLILCCGFFLCANVFANSPFECANTFDKTLPVNKILMTHWEKHNITPPAMASDSVFLRRLTLTAAGRLPRPDEIKEFLNDKRINKRAIWIERILDSPEYADMQAMRFADMLRIKSEFPINLWPNAVQIYHRTLKEDLLADRPLNQMFYQMLTDSGSNFRVPYANFFRASADRSPSGLAKMVLLTTCGMREHSFSGEEITAMAQLFSQVRYKSTTEWKEEIVFSSFEERVIKAQLPDGTTVKINSAETDPRKIYADWLFGDGKEYFARTMTNRVWHWIFGRGIYPVADDLPRIKGFWGKLFSSSDSKNAPFSEDLQTFLNEEFYKSNYSLKHMYSIIMNSALFQASSLDQSEPLLTHGAAYPLRRLEAELLVDALGQITGAYDRYTSVIPEPFTFLPPGTRAVTIADGSISSGVLDNFGRPSRDSGQLSERNTAHTDKQMLYLKNSSALYRRITSYSQSTVRRFRDPVRQLEKVYLDILNRYPTAEEKKAFESYKKSITGRQGPRYLIDTVWILLNSKEFIFHH